MFCFWGAPSTPTGLSASETTHSSVHLRWDPQGDTAAGPGLSYVVICEDLSAAEPTIIRKEVRGIRDPDYTIDGLASATWYKFQLVAFTDIARSGPSDAVTVKTSELG